MIVMILENVPVGLRGELSRWLIEPKAGVFVGHVTALVRDKLWKMCCDAVEDGGVILIWPMNNEQRFDIRVYGITRREVVDLEGLNLILRT